jgi:hypothetical protein
MRSQVLLKTEGITVNEHRTTYDTEFHGYDEKFERRVFRSTNTAGSA